jgi:hypothetical protein
LRIFSRIARTDDRLREATELRLFDLIFRGRNQLLTKTSADILFILALVILQLLINDDWVYSRIGQLDSWYYIGYGLHYRDPNFLNDYYKVSRLPWVLTEFVVRKLVPGYLAAWALHIVTLMVGGASLYALFSRVFDRLTGLIIAAIFVTATFNHGNGGADYHSEMSGALFALTWWLAIRTALAAQDNLGQMLLVGVAAALTVHTSVLFVNLAPYVFFHWYLTSRWAGRKPAVLTFVCAIAVGALAGTLALCTINWMVGRGFLFFMKQFSLAASFVADNSHQSSWWHPWSSGFYWDMRYFGFFAGAALVSIVGAVLEVVGRPRQGKRQHLFLWLGYLVSFGAWTAWQSVGQTALDYDYFAYPLLFPAIGMIAACVPKLGEPAERRRPFWMAVIYGALAVALLFPLARGYDWPVRLRALVFNFATAVATLFIVSSLALRLIRPSVVALAVGIPLVAVADQAITGPAAFAYEDSCHSTRARQSMVIEAHRILYRLQPDYQVHIWFDKYPYGQAPATEVVRNDCDAVVQGFDGFGFAIVSTGFNYLGSPWSMPHTLQDIDDHAVDWAYQSHALLVYVTADPQRIKAFQARIAEFGRTIEPLQTYEVRDRSSVLPLTVFRFAN